jgi:hypothetical protein
MRSAAAASLDRLDDSSADRLASTACLQVVGTAGENRVIGACASMMADAQNHLVPAGNRYMMQLHIKQWLHYMVVRVHTLA